MHERTIAGPEKSQNPSGKLNRIAVLVDGDNLPPRHAHSLVTLSNHLATTACFFVYGAKNPSTAGSWWGTALEEAQADEVYINRELVGKNAAEIRMTACGIRLMSRQDIDGYLIASNDGHLIHLAERLQEKTSHVYGCGTSLMSRRLHGVFRKVFDLNRQQSRNGSGTKSRPAIPNDVVAFIHRRLNLSSGRCRLCDLGSQIAKAFPQYGRNRFGYPTLTSLIESRDEFHLDRSGGGHPWVTTVLPIPAAQEPISDPPVAERVPHSLDENTAATSSDSRGFQLRLFD